MDHRRTQRTTVNATVTVTANGELLGFARVTDTSTGGALLSASLPLQVASEVTLALTTTAARRQDRFKCQAKLVRSTENGFGIEWLQFAPELLGILYDHRLP
jgi:hypothetical protein